MAAPDVRISICAQLIKKTQRPAPRGLSHPQIGHLELEGKTNLSELWVAQFSSVASRGGQEGHPGGTEMWKMPRSPREFCSCKKFSAQGSAGPVHSIPCHESSWISCHLGPPPPPPTIIPSMHSFHARLCKTRTGVGALCPAHLTGHLLHLYLGPPPLCCPSEAGAEIFLGL